MIIRNFNTITHTFPLSDIQTQIKSLVVTSKRNACSTFQMPTTSETPSIKPVVSAFPRFLQDLFNSFFVAVNTVQNTQAISPARRIDNLQSSYFWLNRRSSSTSRAGSAPSGSDFLRSIVISILIVTSASMHCINKQYTYTDKCSIS